MKQVSFIVPFYNREAYLEECLDSILRSGCEDIELILIDDASTDSGAAICRRYAESNPFIQILTHDRQTGPAASRNEGIRRAKGRYLYFIDSDDFIVTEELVDILRILKDNPDIDILLLDYQQFLNGQPLSVKSPPGTAPEGLQTMQAVLENAYWNAQLPAQAWRYFVRRELVVENGITFPELIYGEDSIFSMKLFQKAASVYYHPAVFYNYRISNPDSLTKKADSDRWHMQRYFKERFRVLSGWMNQDRESTYLKQWFEQWIHQCIRGFLFEEEWERMIREIGEACLRIPENYLSILGGDNRIEEYLAEYRKALFEKLIKARKVYLLPACRDNVILAEKWKRDQIRISGFLDNNTSSENHNLRSAGECGYAVENLKEKLERKEIGPEDICVICHWQRIIDMIAGQLTGAGISKETIVEINW